ncbi:MAG: nitroreductase [SAR86 cluster bacterium]|uniref:Nitroreductase n=1 Tax=SAR86 cluster bacterium TaxID=2030880 RepID=A0A2A5C9Z3_9GAMM|nr:MAG: nitroreductase [SAR86 cluster bacterium]
MEKKIDTSEPINNIIATRWSGVSYDAERPVNQAQLLAIMEAARWAPSCFGDQPWRYIVCNKADNAEAWQKLYDCLAEGNQPWCINAPVLIAACHDTQFSMNDDPNPWGAYDTGAASVSMCIQAADLGLMSHQMAGFSADLIREKFEVPARFTPVAAIAIGYQTTEDGIPEAFKGRELSPRKRNPLSENFFMGAWAKDA